MNTEVTVKALEQVDHLMVTPGDWIRLAMAALDQAGVDFQTLSRVHAIACRSAARTAARRENLAEMATTSGDDP